MLRSDFGWLIPAILVAIWQVFGVWRRLPVTNPKDTQIQGKYQDIDRAKLEYFIFLTVAVLLIQVSIPLLPIFQSQVWQIVVRIVGYLLIFIGLSTSLSAVSTLGTNWTGMSEYRIKHGQNLVTWGIYGKVRHPIYLAVILELVGFELVANSWIFVPIFLLAFWVFNTHITNEEELLVKRFGSHYQAYSSRVKRLIPYLY